MNLNASSSAVLLNPLYIEPKSFLETNMKSTSEWVSKESVNVAINQKDSQPLLVSQEGQESMLKNSALNVTSVKDSEKSSKNLIGAGLSICPGCKKFAKLDYLCQICSLSDARDICLNPYVCVDCIQYDEDHNSFCVRCQSDLYLENGINIIHPDFVRCRLHHTYTKEEDLQKCSRCNTENIPPCCLSSITGLCTINDKCYKLHKSKIPNPYTEIIPDYGISDMYSDPIDCTPPASPPRPAILKRSRTKLTLEKPNKVKKTNSDEKIRTPDIFRDLRNYLQKQITLRTFAEKEILRVQACQQFLNHECYKDVDVFNIKIDEYLKEHWENIDAHTLEDLRYWIADYAKKFPERDQLTCFFDFIESHLTEIINRRQKIKIMMTNKNFRSYFSQWMDLYKIKKQKNTNFITILPPSNGFVMKL